MLVCCCIAATIAAANFIISFDVDVFELANALADVKPSERSEERLHKILNDLFE
jgi:hypothetical protein